MFMNWLKYLRPKGESRFWSKFPRLNGLSVSEYQLHRFNYNLECKLASFIMYPHRYEIKKVLVVNFLNVFRFVTMRP